MSDRAPSSGGEPPVHHNTDAERYEVTLDGATAFLQYRRKPDGTLVLLHTETPEALRGRGLGGTLARAALEAARAAGRRVVVLCPFVTTYVQRHPEYAALLAPRGPKE